MLIYILTYGYIILAGMYSQKKKYGNVWFCISVAIILGLVVGFRNNSMGLTDTMMVYYPRFNLIAKSDLLYALSLKDYGFQVFTYFFTRIFGANFLLYKVIVALFYTTSISLLIYHYSVLPWLSYVMFVSLHYYEISFTLMRHTTAMAIIVFAFDALVKDERKKFIFLVLLAALFHQTALVFLVVLLFDKFKPQKWMIVPLAIIVFLFIRYPSKALSIVYNFLASDRFTRYEAVARSKNLNWFFINLAIWFFETLSFRSIIQDRRNKMLYICSCICLAISPLTLALGEMSRITYFFGIFSVPLIPVSIDRFKPGLSRKLVVFFLTGIFVLYFLHFLGPQVNVIPYKL